MVRFTKRLGIKRLDLTTRRLQQQLDEGGILLWVEVAYANRERAAVEMLQLHSADDVHVHELPASSHAVKGGVSHKLSFMEQLGL